MKKYLISALVLLTGIMVSCKDDKEPVESMINGFSTGYTDSKGYISVIKDDMGNEFMVSEKSERFEPDSVYRLVTSLAISENNTARILQVIQPISYKAPETSNLPDSLKVQNPVQINSAYIGGGYLNINLGVKVQKENSKHTLLYARKSNSSKKAKFVIYHNAHGDGEMYTKYAYISIPLRGYGLQKNDTVYLSCKGYEADCDMKFVFK